MWFSYIDECTHVTLSKDVANTYLILISINPLPKQQDST